MNYGNLRVVDDFFFLIFVVLDCDSFALKFLTSEVLIRWVHI